MSWFALFLGVTTFAPRPLDVEADPARVATLTAAQVLQCSEAVYSHCRSYRDSGSLECRDQSGPPAEDPLQRALGEHFSGTSLTFQTAFVDPDRLRFEFSKASAVGDDRFIVWWDGESAQTWWRLDPGVRHCASLAEAIARATGISLGLAGTVPRMLLPGAIVGLRLRDLKCLDRLADSRIGGRRCFQLRGLVGSSVMEIWIDQASFLLLRFDTYRELDDFDSHSMAVYSPEVNVELDPRDVAFDPPGNG